MTDRLCLSLLPLHDTFMTFERAETDFPRPSPCEREDDAGMTKV